MMPSPLRSDALAIWQAALEAVRPAPLVRDALRALPDDWQRDLQEASRILVVGAGKAGAPMVKGLAEGLGLLAERATGLVNVPEGYDQVSDRIRLHFARPAGHNHPTAAGVAGAEEMLALLESAGPKDVAICLLSGGGSALLPAPAQTITLEDKQAITRDLHRSGATIHEMNAVRKHLSRVKGGRLAEAFAGRRLLTLIISDVVGDPLDVIASGPTAEDPTTYADALAVLERYRLLAQAPASVVQHLQAGASGGIPETLKSRPSNVENRIIGNNGLALQHAERMARSLGYHVLNLGPMVEGESAQVAIALAGVVRSVLATGQPIPTPACILLGGETTVTLGNDPGKGGRNQEFALAAFLKLRPWMDRIAILSGGTDGEDGPTDAAGGIVTAETLVALQHTELDPEQYLRDHNAYPFLEQTASLLQTGLTGTNVMDVRLILVR